MPNKLYDYYRSSCSYRVRIALNIKNIPFEKIPISLIKEEHLKSDYLKINPQGLVPTWQDKDILLTQSLSIIEYLNEAYPGPNLLPLDPMLKAHCRQLSYIIACEMHPLNNLRVKKYLKALNWSDEQFLKWYHHWLKTGFEGFNDLLEQLQLSKDFCIGYEITMADICLIPQIYNALRFSFNMDDYPKLMSIYNKCQEKSEFKEAYPNEI